jgi:hypothetical protein
VHAAKDAVADTHGGGKGGVGQRASAHAQRGAALGGAAVVEQRLNGVAVVRPDTERAFASALAQVVARTTGVIQCQSLKQLFECSVCGLFETRGVGRVKHG